MEITRQAAKVANFLLMYGGGVGRLAEALKTDVEAATRIRNAVRLAAPGVQVLDKELKRRGRAGEPVRTWGGRLFHCEPPSGDGRSFEYKMLNTLVQGSAADATKEAVLRWHEASKASRLLVTIHDEIDISTPCGMVGSEMVLLRQVMEGLEFDVRLLSEGYIGKSWGELCARKDL
jgi:DNA polymerase I-like protein with 3'-5' exonuclease and polymerase domains